MFAIFFQKRVDLLDLDMNRVGYPMIHHPFRIEMEVVKVGIDGFFTRSADKPKVMRIFRKAVGPVHGFPPS